MQKYLENREILSFCIANPEVDRKALADSLAVGVVQSFSNYWKRGRLEGQELSGSIRHGHFSVLCDYTGHTVGFLNYDRGKFHGECSFWVHKCVIVLGVKSYLFLFRDGVLDGLSTSRFGPIVNGEVCDRLPTLTMYSQGKALWKEKICKSYRFVNTKQGERLRFTRKETDEHIILEVHIVKKRKQKQMKKYTFFTLEKMPCGKKSLLSQRIFPKANE
ncbi:hypothetical protein GMAR_ORF59 [Golden Marseillevirus]|uniref:hypothetical protein n=1 Tax=Golden Marseillevirus TaxID=1720526 RepID=UPI000877AD4D|nr:hypothetical protein GMAR_ORF59 [Golden Marseillevirus]ALX27434.1 hypothetical protein GMAR_ORF59 [Golden Marseillevirus]